MKALPAAAVLKLQQAAQHLLHALLLLMTLPWRPGEEPWVAVRGPAVELSSGMRWYLLAVLKELVVQMPGYHLLTVHC